MEKISSDDEMEFDISDDENQIKNSKMEYDDSIKEILPTPPSKIHDIQNDSRRKLKSMLENVNSTVQKKLEIEKRKREIEEEIEALKKDTGKWMENINQDNLTYNDMGVHCAKKTKYKRIEVNDISNIIEKLYGGEVLQKVLSELNYIHAQRTSNDKELKVVSTRCNKK